MKQLLFLTLLLSSVCLALPLPAQIEPSISFKTLKFKAYTGDSLSYEYGTLMVPENRLRSPTNTIELALIKLKAKSPRPDFPILFLAGGPGQSGINYLQEEYFQRLVFSLQQNHDVILLDQRGCGKSRPSLIYKLPDADNRALFLSNQRMLALSQEAIRAGTAEFKAKRIDITGYTTIQSADDLNDLCKALGTEKLNVLAVSYGTHLALATARAHPLLIDRMTLIGTSGVNQMHHLPFTYDKQLKKIADLAARIQPFGKLYPTWLAY